MPPTPIPSGFGIAAIKLLRTGADFPNICTFGYAINAVQSADAEADQIADIWIGAFTAATTINTYAFIGVHVLRKNGALLEAGDEVRNTVGTVAAEATSPAIAVRVTKKTALAGRKFRGRVYLPPAYVSEENINIAGTIDSATLTSIQTKCDNFFAAMDAAGRELNLLHADASTPTLITSLVARSSVGTQRRRQAIN